MDYEMLPAEYKNTFSRYTNLLKFIGINIFESSASSRYSKIRLLAFNMIFLPFAIGQFSLIAKIRAHNFLEAVRVVPISVVFLLDVTKMITALVKKSQIREMFIEIGELWPTGLKEGNEKADSMKWVKRMVAFYNVYFIYNSVTTLVFQIIPLFVTIYNIINKTDTYMLPFQMVHLWKINSIWTYLASYACEIGATTPCQLCLFVPFDLVIMSMTSNVSTLFRLLHVDLRNSINETKMVDNTITSEHGSFNKLVPLLKTHQRLLRISDQLSRTFGLVIFIHVAFSSVLICFFAFMAVVCDGVTDIIINLLCVWNGVITIFLMSLTGQHLSDTSSEVADAAYQTAWYKSDIKVKKAILFVITRSQKASCLSALGFSEITLRTFSKIMSSAWTYFNLLIQLYGGK